MKTVTETKKTGPQYRFFSVRKDAIDVEKRTVELAFSSETPYERWFGTEILDHSPQALRLGRLNDGGAVLLDHDTTKHVGVVERVDIGEDKIARAVVRFGRSPEADAAFQDVRDGIRRHVSVGYFIHRMVLEEKTAEGEQSTETYRATDWEPFEISIVAVPADPTVGIGRAAQQEVQTQFVRSVADESTSSADGEQPADTTPANPAAFTGAIMADLKNAPAGATAEVDPVAAEKQRVKDLIAIGEAYGKYIQPKDINDAIANGRSVEQFKDFVMTKMQTTHDASPGIIVGMTQGESKRYSLGRAIQAAITGDWAKAGLELEASRAVEKIFGRTPEGFFIPADVFRRDFNVGTATEAGNLVATDLRTDLYVDALRAKLVASTLGMRILSGLTSSIAIPRKSTASTLGTLTEIGSASETAPAIAQVSLTPKRVGAYVEYSKQALLQSSMPIENMLRDDLIQGAAGLLESGIINGSGTAPQMTGLRNTTGMGTSTGGTAGAAPTWALMVGLETLCAAANAEPDTLAGYLMNTQTRGKLKTVQRGTNLNFVWENGSMPVNGYRVAVTNNVPSNLTKGSSTTVCSSALFSSDWSMAVLGLFGAPDVTVDPYSLAATGQVRITLNQFADFGVRQPGAFAKIDDLLSA
ncbi:MAG: phage major capsid protein [Betaproteobacteria bacterium]|nr:phage major capsid protein [Betaproteobacteria bacterium]